LNRINCIVDIFRQEPREGEEELEGGCKKGVSSELESEEESIGEEEEGTSSAKLTESSRVDMEEKKVGYWRTEKKECK
jgi:hypothetical protein